MTQKGLTPILIVLILAALVGGYVLYSKQKPSTITPLQTTQITPAPLPISTTNKVVQDSYREGWQIYNNTEASYQISYPDKWVKRQAYTYDDFHDDLVLMDKSSQPRLGFAPGEIQLTVGHVKEANKYPPDSHYFPQYFDKELQLAIGTTSSTKFGKLTKVENIKIGGVDAVAYEYNENYEGPLYGYINHLKGSTGSIYSINFFALDKQSLQKHQKEIDEIIKSFKFTQ